MANSLYTKGIEALMKGQIDLDGDTIKVTLVDTADYTVDLAAHDYIDDVPAGARLAGSPAKPAREHWREIATLSKLARRDGGSARGEE